MSKPFYSEVYTCSAPSVQSKYFPMLSESMFYSNGSIFDPSSLVTTSENNNTSLNQVELPHLTGSNVWQRVSKSLSVSTITDTSIALQSADRNQIGGMFAHCLCFWGPELKEIFRNAHFGIQPDPHWKVREMMFIFMSDFIGYEYHLGNAKVQGGTILVVYFPYHIFLHLWQVIF